MNNANNLKQGEELNQLSRLLFDKASRFWYSAIGVEVLVGVVVAIISVLGLSEMVNLIVAILSFLALLSSWIMKLFFSQIYDNAETMRRQSVLTEALGWKISKFQFSEWRRKAGDRTLKKFKIKSRDPEYYATAQDTGAAKLLEMTTESVFWTRHLYLRLRNWIFLVALIAIIALVTVFTYLPVSSLDISVQMKVVYFVYLLMPTILSIDMFGWIIRLTSTASSMADIECDLERLQESGDTGEVQVLRLVYEYNCQLVSGFPILSWFFGLQRDSIQELWNKRDE